MSTITALYPDDFETWISTPAGEHVWNRFVTHALDLVAAGTTRFSADSIVHTIRVEMAREGRATKINNDFTALLARRAIRDYDEIATANNGNPLFELRRSRSDQPGDYSLNPAA